MNLYSVYVKFEIQAKNFQQAKRLVVEEIMEIDDKHKNYIKENDLETLRNRMHIYEIEENYQGRVNWYRK